MCKKFTFKVLLLKNIVNNQPIIKFSMFLDYELTGGCVNAYTREVGQRYFGANVNAASNTESACQSACNSNNACVGYGYHSTASSGQRYKVLSFSNHLLVTIHFANLSMRI